MYHLGLRGTVDLVNEVRDDRTGRPTGAYLAALAVLVLLFTTRYEAAWYSYPFSGHSDEGFIVGPAFRVASSGDLHPHFFNYPTFNCYALAAVYTAIDAGSRLMGGAGFLPEEPTPDHFVVGRLLVMFLSGLTLVAVAEFGRRLIGPAAGVIAAMFLLVSPLFTKYSYIVSVNPGVALWATASGAIAATLLHRRDWRLYALGGVFVGFTVGSKYIGVTAAAPIVLAHFLGSGAGPRRWRDLLLCGALIPAAFLVTWGRRR